MLLFGAAAIALLSVPTVASAATCTPAIGPAVTLTSPANGSLISGGQPTFAGCASTGIDASPQVTVRVYAGASASGTPVHTLTTTPGADGGYSAGVSSPLADGQYTAQAEQDGILGLDNAFSNTSTFEVHNAAPTITLDSPGTKPLLTATPTLTGTAGHAIGDSSTVNVTVYPGAGTTQTPTRVVSGSRDSSGQFSIKIRDPLPDGQYTAVAAQVGAAAVSTSPARTFRIKVHPPALTLTQPASGANVKDQAPVFAGAAGAALGDSTHVSVVLYAGNAARGKPLGTLPVTRTGASWSGTWLKALKLGAYTAKAMQSDDAGHTAVTPPHTFRIVRGPTAIGRTVTLSRKGQPTTKVSIACLAPSGQTCTGNVLVLTSGSYGPVRNGPSGQLRVVFVHVSIPGGRTLLVAHGVSGEVARVLRRSAPLKVMVEASLTAAGGSTTRYSAVRTLRLRS